MGGSVRKVGGPGEMKVGYRLQATCYRLQKLEAWGLKLEA